MNFEYRQKELLRKLLLEQRKWIHEQREELKKESDLIDSILVLLRAESTKFEVKLNDTKKVEN